jgi:hypothetical protein
MIRTRLARLALVCSISLACAAPCFALTPEQQRLQAACE